MAPAVLEGLPGELEQRWTGKIRVLDVSGRVDRDSSDEPSIFITVTLSDPPAGADTWPTEDIWKLRRVVQAGVDAVAPDLEMRWFLEFRTENPEQDGDELTVDLGDA